MSYGLVAVTSYWLAHDAAIAKRALDEAGIDSVIENPAPVKLRVHREDALRAGDVLNDRCDSLPEVGEAVEESFAGCAACGGGTIVPRSRALRFAALSAMAIAFGVATEQTQAAFFLIAAAAVFSAVADRWSCETCGATWK